MSSSEWSLVLFTILSQISVGMVFSILIAFIIAPVEKRNQINSFRVPLLIASVLMLIALFSSFLHLASPFSSVFALSNLQSSWLSREIFMVSFYFALIAGTTFWWKRLIKKYTAALIILLIVAIAGLLLIYSMGKIYIIATVPPWNTPFTLLKFFISTILLGTALYITLTFYLHKEKQINSKAAIKTLTGLIVFTALIKVIVLIFDFVPNTELAVFKPQSSLQIWIYLSWIYWPLGVILYLLNIFSTRLSGQLIRILYFIGFLCFLLSELASRVIFYSSYYRIGI
ncbi:MAG: DmsC/YnfH family molybdoenzyme membrane anchor subunit [Bacteroidales bacterium]